MKSEINLQDVFLDFPIYDAQSLSIRNKMRDIGNTVVTRAKKNISGSKVVHGLKNVNLNLTHGDKLAVLGSNGSGKTTLLKLIAGIYYPTSGKVSCKGELSCMLDIGFGFEQDATGYENIILSNITRGLTKKDIDKLLPQIAEFSGLGDFLHMPLRTYSSGMQARLAFSSAIASTPGILLIDEFFSTGDIEFSERSKSKVLEMMDNSSILIFASHDMTLLKNICNKAILMKNGEIVFTGTPDEVVKFYKETYHLQ